LDEGAEGASRELQFRATLAEYEDCREEIKIRIQERTRHTEIFLTGIPTIFGVALTTGELMITSFAAPFALLIGIIIRGTYFYTDGLAKYIKEVVEKKVWQLTGSPATVTLSRGPWTPPSWLSWESYYSDLLAPENRPDRRKVLYVSIALVQLLSALGLGYGMYLRTGEIAFLALAFLVYSVVWLTLTKIYCSGLWIRK